ncbi:MAG TPA: hypothetical protein VIL37_03250 [Natronosporangium sp.]
MTGPYQQQYPQQPGHPQYPQQPAPPPGAQGGGGQTAIAVTTKFLWLAWIFFLIKPKIFLNGHEVPAVWGRNVIPVQPGQHHLHIHVPYFLPPKVGPADLAVPVQPGQTVELEYKTPLWVFSSGSLGAPPQKYKGAGLMIGLTVALVLIICLCCILNIVASTN